MKLIHKKSKQLFKEIDVYKPQFSTVLFVRLLNLKTNKIEMFDYSTYMNHFEEI